MALPGPGPVPIYASPRGRRGANRAPGNPNGRCTTTPGPPGAARPTRAHPGATIAHFSRAPEIPENGAAGAAAALPRSLTMRKSASSETGITLGVL